MSRALAKEKQAPLGAYTTPDDVAAKCVDLLGLGPRLRIIEPSVGGGAFVRAIRAASPHSHVTGIDIDPNVAGFDYCDLVSAADWLQYFPLANERIDWVIGNPPYSEAEAHVRHAFGVATHGVAFLLRLNFLEGQRRRALWDSYPPRVVTVLSKRPSFTGGGTDATAYMFAIWKRTEAGNWDNGTSPRIVWI